MADSSKLLIPPKLHVAKRPEDVTVEYLNFLFIQIQKEEQTMPAKLRKVWRSWCADVADAACVVGHGWLRVVDNIDHLFWFLLGRCKCNQCDQQFHFEVPKDDHIAELHRKEAKAFFELMSRAEEIIRERSKK